jgi:hypothetical protein
METSTAEQQSYDIGIQFLPYCVAAEETFSVFRVDVDLETFVNRFQPFSTRPMAT